MSVHWIQEGDRTYAVHVSGDHLPSRTEFVTPDDYKQQLGYIVYPAGGAVVPHRHRPSQRTIQGTSGVKQGPYLGLDDKERFAPSAAQGPA